MHALRSATGAFAALLLSGCSFSESPALPGAVGSTLVRMSPQTKCPAKYTFGCVTITRSGPVETATFSCSGRGDCHVPKWSMYSEFQTVGGRSASKDLVGKWNPNPYYSGPSTQTINSIRERRPLKATNKIEYVEALIACPAQSSCTGIGTVGIIPKL